MSMAVEAKEFSVLVVVVKVEGSPMASEVELSCSKMSAPKFRDFRFGRPGNSTNRQVG